MEFKNYLIEHYWLPKLLTIFIYTYIYIFFNIYKIDNKD